MVNSMIQAYPDNLAVIEHHVYDDWSTLESHARLDYYESLSAVVPLFAFDGLTDGWPITNYESNFLARESVETDVTIEMGVEQISSGLYGVAARIAIEPDGRTREMAIHFVQVLDHWPNAAPYFRNTYKQAATPQTVFLFPGDSTIVYAEFELDADSLAQLSDVGFFVWAQDDKDAGPAEVHQAAKMAWPYTPLDTVCGDIDGNEDVGVSDYWLLLDAFATTAGDPRYVAAADMNDDGLISWPDYILWVGCYRDANGRDFDPNDTGDDDGPSLGTQDESSPSLKRRGGRTMPAAGMVEGRNDTNRDIAGKRIRRAP